MTLGTFIDKCLRLGDYVRIKTITNISLYDGVVANIPYHLVVKSTFVNSIIKADDDTTIYVVYH